MRQGACIRARGFNREQLCEAGQRRRRACMRIRNQARLRVRNTAAQGRKLSTRNSTVCLGLVLSVLVLSQNRSFLRHTLSCSLKTFSLFTLKAISGTDFEVEHKMYVYAMQISDMEHKLQHQQFIVKLHKA